VGVVLEIKHATYFAALGWNIAALVADELRVAGWDGDDSLVIESFEGDVLDDVRERGIRASFVYLLEASGAAADLVARAGRAAPTYAQQLTPRGLDELAPRFDGISVSKAVVLRRGGERLVPDAHARGLSVFTWTCRAENQFLDRRFRLPGEQRLRAGGIGLRFRAELPSDLGDYVAEWRRLKDAGVDGVFVDQPDLWIAAFR
jgi:glycerophosphoryl diester phosphodiesterase